MPTVCVQCRPRRSFESPSAATPPPNARVHTAYVSLSLQLNESVLGSGSISNGPTTPYFYEYPTNSNCVSVSRGTFQPRRFSRQSIKEDAVHHGAPQDDQPQRNLQSSPAISPIAFLIVTLAIKNQHIFRKTKAAHAF